MTGVEKLKGCILSWPHEFPPNDAIPPCYSNCRRCLIESLIPEIEAEIAAWKTAVYSLTPGGSEFVADPKRCAVYIRERTNYPKLIVDLRAEIAALTEKMKCGHPKACWVHGDIVHASGVFNSNLGLPIVNPHCTACEHERLAVAAALREAAKNCK